MLWLLLVSLTLHCLTIWILFAHLTAIQAIQHALHVWDEPKRLAQPHLPPGTTWAVSDREIAHLERKLAEESAQRSQSLAGSNGWPRTSKGRRG